MKQENSLRRKHSYNWMLKKKWNQVHQAARNGMARKMFKEREKKQDARCIAVFLWQQRQGLVALGNSLGCGLLG